MFLANIISQDKELITNDFNLVNNQNEIIKGLPTLIIGYDYIKNNYNKYDILDRRLDDNTFWTFRKVEKRELHDADIFNFSTYVYTSIASTVEYHYIDPFQISFKNAKKFLNILFTGKSISYLFVDEKKYIKILYILINNIIYGVDISLMNILEFKTDKLIDKLKTSENVFLAGDNIFIEYQKGIEFLDNQHKYVPLLYRLKNG